MLINTDKRMITVDKKGLTGKKQMYLFVPLEKIVFNSITSAGGIDLDSDLEIFLSGLDLVKAVILKPTKNTSELFLTLKSILFE